MASAATQESPDVPRLSLSVDHPASTSPFPSPGSPFLPPPRLSAHEFALRTSITSNLARTSMHKKKDDDPPPPPAPVDNDATPTMKTAFPRSGLSPLVSPIANGTAQGDDPVTPPITPKITIPDPSPSPASEIFDHPHRNSLTSSRPAPPSPALSRRTSAAISLSRRSSTTRSRHQSKIPQDSEPSTSTAPAPSQPQKRRSLLVKIRDFAFPLSDDRHIGRGSDAPRPNRIRYRSSMYSDTSSSSSVSAADEDTGEDSRGSWGSFRWNTLSTHFPWGGSSSASSTDADSGPSHNDFARNFDASSPTEESSDPYNEADEDGEDEDEFSPADDGPLVSGLYRAMFAFEPEGTAEMALEEEQVVRVVGRGGGVGWAIVEKEGGEHALVPESYLELVTPDVDVEADTDA